QRQHQRQRQHVINNIRIRQPEQPREREVRENRGFEIPADVLAQLVAARGGNGGNGGAIAGGGNNNANGGNGGDGNAAGAATLLGLVETLEGPTQP
ncbi:hypothetical protein, partial [Microtetraspora sp. AC03309]|uniref:hypothetical protein n=1 Tax=Microtetraspora sp. AC03309 TaxID=2779376 RepID=UPI001E372915